MTQPIPKPELLNPDRMNRDSREEFTLDDHRTRGDLLSKELEKSCAYAEQLWDTLDFVRRYLLHSLPPDAHSFGTHAAAGASPTGPDDDEGWQKWIETFGTVTSVLCGAHGDSGFGLSEARTEARLRQDVQQLAPRADQPDLSGEPLPQSPAGSPAQRVTTGGGKPYLSADMLGAVKAAATVVIGFLALRGLRGRPESGIASRL